MAGTSALVEPNLPGAPLAAAIQRYGLSRGLVMRDSRVWADADVAAVQKWAQGRTVTFALADRVLCTLGLMWWEVWDADRFPDVALVFDPEDVAA